MKKLYSFSFLLAFPIFMLGQNISGLWSGKLVNDSTHKVQNFEMGLSEYRGRITGYTYTTFIENDTFYYSIKRITAERKDGYLVIEDEKMVGNNFPERAAKHVRQTTTFPLINDSTIDFSNGRWSTNQTKKYYSIGGSAEVKEQEDEKESDLLTHLQEMKVKTDIAVIKKKDEPIVKNTPQEKKPIRKKELPSGSVQNNNNVVTENKNVDPGKTIATQPPATSAEIKNNSGPAQSNTSVTTENKNPGPIKPVTSQPTTTPAEIKNVSSTDPAKPDITVSRKEEVVLKNNNSIKENNPAQIITKPSPAVVQNTTQKTATVNANTSQLPAKKQEPTQITQPKQVVQQPVTAKTETAKTVVAQNVPVTVTPKKEIPEAVKELPVSVSTRKSETIQDIYFKSDSLVLSLYDNGIVDGDTVSVFLNGENIISKQKLKEAAIKKTIYTTSAPDSLQLVLFAENLGTIPPNTGLLTIRDGETVYQVRFSADLNKNASITLKRKKG